VDLFPILLFLHALGAIVAFGPGFAAMVVGPMVAKEPQHANFYARTQLATARRIVMPVSASMAVTGLAMILVRGWSTITGGRQWLALGILLYVVAVAYSMAVQARAGRRLVELTAQPPAPGTPPSPELRATVARVRQGGMVLAALVVVIAWLMVAKPF
jgi:uncharacterized membrane protein